jgi:SAM-dependent methyltransferase
VSAAGARWWQRLTAPVRRLRWRAAAWSQASDREFHDRLFGAQDYDPFSRSYPGYLTIRRFADHAERHFDGVRTVVDLGCGPGEITCELARRRPDVAFAGVDHSEAAIARARVNAARLGLTNITFDAGDVERYEPREAIDLVVMFDAFHHVLDPAAFVSRMGARASRFFLIEPAGTWLGRWDRRADLDWIPATIRQMRERLEHQWALGSGLSALGGGSAPKGSGPACVSGPDPLTRAAGAEGPEPTEHRYTLTDLERFFAGYALEIRGTMAGLELYGRTPHARSPLGDRFGDVGYELVASLENALHEQGLDLALKHWAILATPSKTPGVFLTTQEDVRRLSPGPVPEPLLPAYGVTYRTYSGPAEVRAGEAFQARVELENTGWLPWDSRGDKPVLLSYHWLDAGGRSVVRDGRRTPLARVVNLGETVEAVLRVQAPGTPGRFTLAIDLVHEGAAWFSDEGVVPMRQTVRVQV